MLICTYCNEVFESPGAGTVKTHFINHHSHLATLTCDMCNMKFFEKRLLNEHWIKMHQDDHFVCDACDKTFTTKATLREHQKSHGEKIHKCPHCPKAFSTSAMRNGHVKLHDEKFRSKKYAKTEICQLCGKTFNKDGLRHHMKKDHGDDQLNCEECGKIYKTKTELSNHKDQTHRTVCCEFCGQNVKKAYYKFHKLSNHSELKDMPYVCQICMKGFIQKQKFIVHQNVHTGEKPFSCHFCDRAFKDLSNRAKHMRETHPELYKASKIKGNKL